MKPRCRYFNYERLLLDNFLSPSIGRLSNKKSHNLIVAPMRTAYNSCPYPTSSSSSITAHGHSKRSNAGFGKGGDSS